MTLRALYESLVALCGPIRCAPEDWHTSKWKIVEKAGKISLEPRTKEGGK